MSPEEVRQYSLLLLRLQRTHDFFKNAQGGIVNAGSSNNPVGNEIHERARAEHRIIYKNTTKIEQLGFIEKETTGKGCRISYKLILFFQMQKLCEGQKMRKSLLIG